MRWVNYSITQAETGNLSKGRYPNRKQRADEALKLK
jgi:hypothetical protein